MPANGDPGRFEGNKLLCKLLAYQNSCIDKTVDIPIE